MTRVPAWRLTIYVGGAHTYQHRPLSTEIVHRAHRAGLRGATVMRGIEGFGRHAKIHTKSTFKIVDHTPSAVIIVDTPERIHSFLLDLDDIADKCLIVRDETEMLT